MKETRIYTTCDRCNQEAEPVVSFSFIVARSDDGAGRMENDHEEVDLCIKCASKWIGQAFDKGLQGRALMDYLKKRKP